MKIMRTRFIARHCLLALITALSTLGCAASAWAQAKAIGPLKAFKGPEGQVISMIEVNDPNHMLVHFKNIGGDLEGRSRIYLLDTRSAERRDVYLERKQGSKTARFVVLSQRAGGWLFTHPSQAGVEFPLRYSEAETKLGDVQSLLNSASE